VSDRKRYSIKNKVNLGIYRPSFTVQPVVNIDEYTYSPHDGTNELNQNEKSMSEENVEDGSVTAEVSPKITMRRQSVDDELNVDSQIYDSTAVRKVSLPLGGFSF